MSDTTHRRTFIRIAAKLKPVVTVGAGGLTEGVLQEIERALRDHELIKIRLNVEDRDLRRATAEQLADQLDAEPIQRVGKTVVLHRANPEVDQRLSNVARNAGN